MTGTCQITTSSTPCENPGDTQWEGGCIHEHINTGLDVCAEHRPIAAGGWSCVPCKDHECTVKLHEVTRTSSPETDVANILCDNIPDDEHIA
jgi:hypothetical protein